MASIVVLGPKPPGRRPALESRGRDNNILAVPWNRFPFTQRSLSRYRGGPMRDTETQRSPFMTKSRRMRPDVALVLHALILTQQYCHSPGFPRYKCCAANRAEIAPDCTVRFAKALALHCNMSCLPVVYEVYQTGCVRWWTKSSKSVVRSLITAGSNERSASLPATPVSRDLHFRKARVV